MLRSDVFIFYFLFRGLRAAGQADQGVAVLRQALKAGVRHIDEQASAQQSHSQPPLPCATSPTKVSPERFAVAKSALVSSRSDSLQYPALPRPHRTVLSCPTSLTPPPSHSRSRKPHLHIIFSSRVVCRHFQVCSILLDLCAVKGRMGLAEEIASLMETHRIPKGDEKVW